MHASEILVIILSSVLAIFLLLSIVLVALLIRITLQIKRIATTAEQAVGSVETVLKNMSTTTSKAFLGRLVIRGLKRFKKDRR